ncbi:MAG TPA: amino acid ABC transporter permease [Rhodopseudomonas sp.]|uniref:amino acid ABC transporter permease n=1 Tax=Rhodopseudomonas sp. TaxID=1078 RepID=UPI002ED9A65A
MTVTSLNSEPRRMPRRGVTVPPWRRGLLDSPANIAITLTYLLVVGWLGIPLLRWAILDATFNADAAGCASSGGACWAFLGEKWRFILFGTYPVDRQWRPASACLLLIGLLVAACIPRFWGRGLVYAGLAGLVAAAMLLIGVPGPMVATDQWGGLPVTLVLSVGAFAGAFPLAIGLALWRRSDQGGVRWLATAFIEIVRGVPLISLLYMATLLFPLMLPVGASLDKFVRAGAALTIFVAAYLAEIIRAGLQAVPRGQYEAALSLGLSHRQATLLVVLPQALRAVIPPMVNLATGMFQETTLVVIIGMFDLLNTARAAANDPNWLGYYNEAFAFVAAIYFVFCFSLSRYSLWLERRFGKAKR